MKDEVARTRALLGQATTVLVLSHTRPDGDAVGSLIALSQSLAAAGKQVTPVLSDGVPERFRFLPGSERVQDEPPEAGDVVVAVDCSDLERLGFPLERLPHRPDLNLDHHPTNTRFADINIVSTDAAATSEILYELLLKLDLPIDREIATNLLAGIVTDTIGFRTDNVRARTLEVAARLLEYGPPLAELYERALLEQTFPAMRYWGRALLKLNREGGLIWTTMTLEDREHAGYVGDDDADLINLLTTIDEARVTVVFIEQPRGNIKVSWRSRSGYDVSSLAASFGGGGHHQAAGAMVEGSLVDVCEHVLHATRQVFESKMEMGK